MSVSNVNNTNNIKALLLKKTSTASREARKPEYLKMTGSIFAAPKETNPARNFITELNTQKSLVQMKSIGSSKNGKSSLNPENFEGIDNASDGKKAISTAENIESSVESQISQTENDQITVENLSNRVQNLENNIIKDDKSFVQKLKTDQDLFNKDNEKIIKLNQETEETQTEIDNAQHELDSLMATNSFEINSGSGSGNQDRIKELQGFIGSKVVLLQNNGKAIYSLQRNQSRAISRMNLTNNSYVNTQNSNEDSIESEESKNSDIIDVANKVEQYSAIAQAGGQVINMAGAGLIALGQSLSGTKFGSSAGQVLVSVGTAMQKVGTTVELVGQYGQTAANLTKTVAYTADGNILGAMQSCSSALQSGTAAIDSTKNIGNTFKDINNQATQARQNIEAKTAAKDAVKNMDKKQLKEMGGKKAVRKFMTADLRQQMKDNNINKLSDMKNFVANNEHIEVAKNNAKNEYTNAKNESTKNLTYDKTNNIYKNEKGKTVSNKQITRKTNKNFKNTISKKNESLPKTSINMESMLKTFSSSLTNIGTVFLQNETIKTVSANTKKSTLPQYQMDARTRRITERNQKYRRYASHV